LGSPVGQGLEQPTLQCVVIAIVVLLPDDDPLRVRQALDQCLGRD
jgi:hypothetical protein